MADLQLAVKGVFFHQIKRKEKKFEYRLDNEYWKKRLINKAYDRLIITLGYPKRGDMERTLIFPYNGFIMTDIKHEHFGDKFEHVFALILDDNRRRGLDNV